MVKKLSGGVAVIEVEGKHFLIQQSNNKPFGSQWRHPGGSFEENETEAEGIAREIKEEINLDIKVLDEKPIHIEKTDYKSHYFGFYKAVIIGGEMKVDMNEIQGYGYFTIDEIKRLSLMKATRSFYDKNF